MRITDIQDEGSIVVVWLGDNEDAPTRAVYFDHRSFRAMVEARRGDLRGECRLDEGEDGHPVVVFEDEGPQPD